MGTRSVIARTIPDGGFKGVYHHWDGYPTGLGQHLWKLLHTDFKGDLAKMLVYVIDQHSAGWSTLFSNSETGKPECFCHPNRKRSDEPQNNWFTNKNVECDIEWIYAFNVANRLLLVTDTNSKITVTLPLDGPEPDWTHVECGENLERCHHYAWFHFPELKDGPMSNLTTAAYLGQRAFQFHDAIAVIVNGKRYKLTGSGHSAGYERRRFETIGAPHYSFKTLPTIPANAWISSVKARNGRRKDIPTALVDGNEYTPYPGVTWVFPPTKSNPTETVR